MCVCSSGTCYLKGGNSCSSDTDCDGTLVCGADYGNTCVHPDQVAQDGNRLWCDTNADCADGSYCNTAATGQCWVNTTPQECVDASQCTDPAFPLCTVSDLQPRCTSRAGITDEYYGGSSDNPAITLVLYVLGVEYAAHLSTNTDAGAMIDKVAHGWGSRRFCILRLLDVR